MEDPDLSFLLEEGAVAGPGLSGGLAAVIDRARRRRRRHRAIPLVAVLALAAAALGGAVSSIGGRPRLATAGPALSGGHHFLPLLAVPRGLEWMALPSAAAGLVPAGSGEVTGPVRGGSAPGPCTVLFGCGRPTSPPAEVHLLFVRRVDGVEMRALLAVLPVLFPIDLPGGMPGTEAGGGGVLPLPRCAPREEVIVELRGPRGSQVEAVLLGAAPDEPLSTLAALAVRVPGAPPSLLVVARAGPSVARVELRVPGGGSDAMAPAAGVAALLVPWRTRAGAAVLSAARRPVVIAVGPTGAVVEAVAVPSVPSIAEPPAWIVCLGADAPGAGGARPEPLAG